MNYIRTKNSFVVVIGNETFTFDTSHPSYEDLTGSIKGNDEEIFLSLISIGDNIEKWSKGNFEFKNGHLYYRGFEIHRSISDIIQCMIEEEFDSTPMLRFLENLYRNPSNHAVIGLYDWLAHKSLAITEDGHFLAYKYVSVYAGDDFIDKMGREVTSGDFVDSHSGSYRNNVGDINTMPRFLVNDDRDRACESGFHVGTLNFVCGDTDIVMCKVNPANVVSIPHDSNCQKIRCCEYEVVSKFDKTSGKMPIVFNDENEDDEDDDDDYEEENLWDDDYMDE